MTPTQAKMCVCVCVFKYRAGKSSGSTAIYVSVHVPPTILSSLCACSEYQEFFFSYLKLFCILSFETDGGMEIH